MLNALKMRVFPWDGTIRFTSIYFNVADASEKNEGHREISKVQPIYSKNEMCFILSSPNYCNP